MKVDAKYHQVNNIYSLAERMQVSLIYPPIEAKLFKISNKITAVSLAVAGELREYGLNPRDITVIGNGVDENIFYPTREKQSTDKYILYTGILRLRKGLFDLVDCANIVCKERPDTKFVVCGRGALLSNLLKKTKKMGLQDNFLFLGYVKKQKLIQMYQNATMQVVPSHYEGVPTVLLEGMSCGLPVVATNIGSNADIISSGSNGFLVPPKCPEAMANVILDLLANYSLRKMVGKELEELLKKTTHGIK